MSSPNDVLIVFIYTNIRTDFSSAEEPQPLQAPRGQALCQGLRAAAIWVKNHTSFSS